MSNENNKRSIEWLFRIFVSVSIVCFGVFRHLFGLNDVVGNLLESGLASSSQMALVEVHLITILELMFVVWTLFLKVGSVYQLFMGILLLVYWVSYAMSFGNTSFVNSDLTSIYGFTGIPLVVVITFMITLFASKWKEFKMLTRTWIGVLISVALIGGYSTYYLSIPSEFSDLGGDYGVKYANWDKYWEKVEEQAPEWVDQTDYTLCFFNVSCSHCNETAKRLGVYRKSYPEKKILLVFFSQAKDTEFWESNEVVEGFLERNQLSLPYLKLKDYEAITIAGNEFPSIIEMIDKKPVRHYVGGEVNAYACDQLFK